jgi:hypothetical protein
MNPETKVLSELIGTIYDAPLDPTLWQGVLKKLAEFVGGSAASIYSMNSAAGTVYHQLGVEPHRTDQGLTSCRRAARPDGRVRGPPHFDMPSTLRLTRASGGFANMRWDLEKPYA